LKGNKGVIVLWFALLHCWTRDSRYIWLFVDIFSMHQRLNIKQAVGITER